MKLSLEVMEQIIKKATAKEIDFLLYSMRFQDNMGIIKGITRAEACRAIGIHKSKFYDIIKKLEDKGLIKVFWSEKHHGFWTISIIGNSFVEKEDYKMGYINLNTVFLWSEGFLNLTKAEKIICLKILALYRESRKKIVLRLQTLMDWTGMSLQSVRKYVVSIKSVFMGTDAHHGLIMIDLSYCAAAFSRNVKTEREIYDSHLLNYILAFKRALPSDKKEIKDTLTVFSIMGGRHGTNAVATAVIKCLDNYKKLIPKYINKMAQIVGNNKNLIEVFY